MIKIDGNKYKAELLEQYKCEVEEQQLDIRLDIIYVGDDPASKVYVRKKIEAASYAGIKTELHHLDTDTSEDDVLSLIDELNADREVTGIILQSPVPKQINFSKCAERVLPQKDIDGITSKNIFALYENRDQLLPCTVRGIIKLLMHYGVEIEGKNVVIVGRSEIVGRPLALALNNRNATVTLCHSKTKNLSDYTRIADILISAVGKPGFIKSDMVKDGFVGIDVGTAQVRDEVSGKMKTRGDFDYDDIKDKASLITPVPGGVGPMTVACVVGNLLKAKRLEKEIYGKTIDLKK